MKYRFIALIIPVLMFGCEGSNKESIQNSPKISEGFSENVKTVKPEPKIIEKEILLTGKVVTDPDKTINYSSLIDGVISKSNFKFGQYVKKGDTMLEIRSSELSRLDSELIIAGRNLESAELKFRNQMISEPEYLEAKTEVERLQSDIRLYGENKGSGVFSVKSPSDGFVIEKYGHTGTPFTAGESLFTVADISTVRIVANVYAGNLQYVEEGQDVELTSIAYPDRIFKGKINFLSQIFDPEDKTLKAHIDIPNKDLMLKPDMSMIVKVNAKEDIIMPSIPKEAIIFDNNKYFVVVRNSDYSIREISIHQNNSCVSYIGSGLDVNDNVVVTNQLLIYNELKGK